MNSAGPATGSRAGSLKKRTPSDWRRLARRQHDRLTTALAEAQEQLEVAEGLGCKNDSERLRTEIHGRDYMSHAEGLRFEIRTVETALRDDRIVRRCAELGITVSQLVDWQRRHDRAHGAAPDENPSKTGTPYRGVHWRSTLGRGAKAGTAR